MKPSVWALHTATGAKKAPEIILITSSLSPGKTGGKEIGGGRSRSETKETEETMTKWLGTRCVALFPDPQRGVTAV